MTSRHPIRKDDISYPVRALAPAVRSVRIREVDEKPRIVDIEAAERNGGPSSPSSASSAPAPPVSKPEKKTKKDEAGFRHLFVAATRHDMAAFACATAASGGVAAAKTVYALLLGQVFQAVTDFGSGTATATETLQAVARGCLELTMLGVGMSVAGGLLMAMWIVNGETRARTVRLSLFGALARKDMAWYDGRRGGMASLMAEQYTQMRDLQAATSQLLGYIVSDVAVCVACVCVALVKSWALTLVLLATVPVSVVVLQVLGRGTGPASEGQRAALNDAAKYATAALVGIDVVKVYGGHDTELWLYLGAVRRAAQHYARQARAACAQMGYIKLWMVCLFVVGFWYGITLVTQGRTTAGNVLTAFYAVLTAFQSLESLGTQWMTVVKGMRAGKALEAMLEGGEGIDENARLQPSLPPRDLVLDNVTFAYPSNPQTKVLDRCTMRFPAGRVSFVVGRSGSGKSTIADLLVQFYRPTTGRVLVDGVSAGVIDRRWLRDNIALIQQASTVFDGTFGWNVALGGADPDAVSREQIREACDTALLQSTVANLAAGLDTRVGGRGASLSGGQRQRLALARAKIRNPAVLVLDETTSGLDPRSAQMVVEAVRSWRRGRTTIIITHDLGQIGDDDYAFVMETGRLVQHGTFAAAKREGAMRALVETAAADTDTLESPGGGGGGGGGGSSSGEDNSSYAPSEPRERPPSVFLKRTSMLGAPFAQQTLLHPFPSYRSTRLFDPFQVQPTKEVEEEEDIDIADDDMSDNDRDSLDLICARGQRAQTMRLDGTSVERHQLVLMDKTETTPKESKEADHVSLMAVLATVWPALDRGARVDLVFGCIACLVAAASNPAFSFVFARMLTAFWLPPGVDKLAAGRPWALALVGLSVVDSISIFSSFYLAERVSLAWGTALRAEALKRVLRQPKSWWVASSSSSSSSSTIIECLDRGGEEMRKIVSVFVPILLMAAGMVVVSVVWALAVAWRLTLVVLAAGPVVVIVATQVAARISDTWEARSNHAAEAVSAVFSDVFTNIRVVRALTLEDYFAKTALADTVAAAYRTGRARAWRTGLLYGINQGIPNWLVALVFYYGTTTLSDAQSVDALIQVVNLLLFSIGTAAALLGNVPQMAASKTVAGEMLAYATLPLHASHEHDADADAKHREPSVFPVRMDHLVFRYPMVVVDDDDRHQAVRPTVLRDLSFVLRPGQLVGIVGPSGGGKSTVLSLLLRLYADDARPSKLSFGGLAASDLDTAGLRAHMAYVPQQPYLFPATVRHNMAYGLAEDSPLRETVRLQQAARAAGIDEFIASLPEGYDTVVGGGGGGESDSSKETATTAAVSSLSGGQAQRVCVARALLRQPQLLVLDEPTSALDPASAETIRETVRRLVPGTRDNKTPGMTVVVATHSKAMMRLCDRLLVVQDGTVAADGAYDELLRQGGVFSRLVGDIDE